MALEALLPSEVARLVYGYLNYEKCTESAKTFLHESPHLEECRTVVSCGRSFSSRVSGYTLMDILEQFCLVSSIVQEKIIQIDDTGKLKNCLSLVYKIKILLQEYNKEQTNIHNTREHSKNNETSKDTVCSPNQKTDNRILQKGIESSDQNYRPNSIEIPLLNGFTNVINNSNDKCTDKVPNEKTDEPMQKLVECNSVENNESSQQTAKSQVLNSNALDNKLCSNLGNSKSSENDQNIEMSLGKFSGDKFSALPSKESVIIVEKTSNPEFTTPSAASTINLNTGKSVNIEFEQVTKNKVEKKLVELCEKDTQHIELQKSNNEIMNMEIEEISGQQKIVSRASNELENIGTNKITQEPCVSTAEITNQNNMNSDSLNLKLCGTNFKNVINSKNTETECATEKSSLVQNQNIVANNNANYVAVPQVSCPQTNVNPLFFNANETSTPIKTFAFDTCDWFPSSISTSADLTNCVSTAAISGPTISPIIAKNTSLHLGTFNLDQTLHTPDIICPPKNRIVNNANADVPVSESQKMTKMDSGLQDINDIIMQTLQKADGIPNSIPTLVKNNSEVDKLFGLDTINLYGTDSNGPHTMQQHIANIPEISMENSISLTGTGLSPFLKKNKTPFRNEKIGDINLVENPTNNTEPEKNESNSKNVEVFDPRDFAISASQNLKLFEKYNNSIQLNTPASLVMNSGQDNFTQRSRSTPKKCNSHVRVLDFDRPWNRTRSDGNLSNINPESIDTLKQSLPKGSHVSHLFQSPEINNEVIIEQKLEPTTQNSSAKVPTDQKEVEEAPAAGNEKTNVDLPINQFQSEFENTIASPDEKSEATNVETSDNENGKSTESNALENVKLQDNLKRSADSAIDSEEKESVKKFKKHERTPKRPKKSSKSPKKFAKKRSHDEKKSSRYEKDRSKKNSSKDDKHDANKKEKNTHESKYNKNVEHSKKKDDHKKITNKNDEKKLHKKEKRKENFFEEDPEIVSKLNIRDQENKHSSKLNENGVDKTRDQKKNKENLETVKEKKSSKSSENKDVPVSENKQKNLNNKTPHSDEQLHSSKKNKEKLNDDCGSEKLSGMKSANEPLQELKKETVAKQSIEMKNHDKLNNLGEENKKESIKLEEKISSIGNAQTENDEDKKKDTKSNKESKENSLEDNEINSNDRNKKKPTSHIETKKFSQLASSTMIHQDSPTAGFQTTLGTEMSQLNETQLSTENSSLTSIDYKKIEEQLSRITHESIESESELYVHVEKMEGGKMVKKKYAKLKTLDSSSVDSRDHNPLNDFVLDFGTPQKEVKDVPPTPKLLSPESLKNSNKPMQIVNEDSKSVLMCLPTPTDCPPTPKIYLSPPRGQDNAKRPQRNTPEGAPFYKIHPIALNKIEVVSKITYFKEQIEENMESKNHAPEETQNDQDEESPHDSAETQNDQEEESNHDPAEIQNCEEEESPEFSEASHSSDSSSSSSSSTSSSCSSLSSFISNDEIDDENADSNNVVEDDQSSQTKFLADKNEKNGKDTCVAISEKDAINDNLTNKNKHDAQLEELRRQLESSPQKVFSVNKTDEELDQINKETPAKEESNHPELDIHETPYVSKPAENTNLHARISELMIEKERENEEKLKPPQEAKGKPKIIKVEQIKPATTMKPPQLPNSLNSLLVDTQLKAQKIKEEQIKHQQQRIVIDKCSEELEQAVESITAVPISKKETTPEESNAIPPSPSKDLNESTESAKIERLKAVESITRLDRENDLSEHTDDSDSDTNLQLVLDEEEENENNSKSDGSVSNEKTDDHSRDGIFQAEEEIPDVEYADNIESFNNEFTFEWDENNSTKGKRRPRVKHYTKEELQITLAFCDGEPVYLHPTDLDIIIELNPVRKGSKAAKSATNTVTEKPNLKRKSTNVISITRKRRKNAFILS
ncbi:hypothetical protein TKK_0000706 [Trichogramma kaykai]